MKSCKSRTTLYFDYSPDRNDSIMTSWHDADTRETVWPVKSRQTSIKLPKNESTRKMKDFDTYTKITLNGGNLGNKNCCQRLSKVAQSAINRPIWSHWTCDPLLVRSFAWCLSPQLLFDKILMDAIRPSNKQTDRDKYNRFGLSRSIDSRICRRFKVSFLPKGKNACLFNLQIFCRSFQPTNSFLPTID